MADALILDCDGVLAITEPAHLGAANAAFEAAGLELRWDEAMFARLVQTAGMRAQCAAYFSRFGWPGGEADNTDLLDRIETAHLKAFREAVRGGQVVLREGAADLVEAAASAGQKIAVCSDDHADAAMACLSLLGLQRASQVSVMVGRSDVSRGKPEPDLYLEAASRLAASPAACLVVDDTASGCAAGVKAGMQVIAAPLVAGANAQAFPGAKSCVSALDAIDPTAY
ncbi:MAG: HAD-IA family hydrolase [Hyphomonadaceae bacterium]|nr:HAD-IA family hydrolase [Hyphomonadaceae bacterium]